MTRVDLSLFAAWAVCFAVGCGSSSDNGRTTAAGGAGGSGNGASGGNSGVSGGGAAPSGGAAANNGAAGESNSQAGGSNSQAGATGSGVAGSDSSGAAGAAGTPPVARPALVTSGPGAYWKEGALSPMSGGTATVTIDPTKVFQKWIGFGGTFNEAGWDALSVLSPAERERAMRLLFSAAEGANFAWGRLPIGASDYALDRYTLDDTENNAPDLKMEHFSIERDKLRLIPFIKAAQAVKGDIEFWASPWTPPPWMKNPANYDGTDAPLSGGSATFNAKMKGDADTLAAYALYFAKYVEEYGKLGIPISDVSPQNEPGYATRYPSCLWDDGVLGTFVGGHLGPTLAEHGLATKVWFGTLSNDNTYPTDIMSLTADALKYTDGVTLQWNTIGRIPSILSAHPDLLIMQSEHKCGNYPFSVAGTPAFNPDKPANDHAYAVESWGYIKQWIVANSNGYSAWNMVLDVNGKNLDAQRPWPQNALLVVDRTAKQLIVTPVYYVFRHLSYFVDPGAVRVNTMGGDAVAFKNPDGSLVTVLFNSGSATTSTVALGAGTTVQVQMPAQGWATIYWKG
ncbi:MAG TPA: glycoside hydrolase family 30 beta sandwich domain-containing protein [Polyangiaceae bacterium]|nr:glycoside hydrolase family 30 beta sandwich domain-containing protein [Polyangiaceae bacterium]